jgi:protein KTI12
LNKEEYYKDSAHEKILRASIKSNVEKFLDPSRIVIVDAQNYIKGYRYELYCLARNAQT